MSEPTTTVGAFLRREREHRGITLKAISEQTKISVPLLEGLEADDLTRWPGGIFRRAFVRGYAGCVGLDPDVVVRRFEEQHRPQQPDPSVPMPPESADSQPAPELQPVAAVAPERVFSVVPRPAAHRSRSLRRVYILATAADLTVAVVLGLGSAAAGSRMLWPVLLIAVYYALGSLLTGTTPMMALLADEVGPEPARPEAISEALSRGASRKARHENVTREARHENAPRRRHERYSQATN